MRRLEGHTAVITVAGHGIGKAISEAFAEEGSMVQCISRNPENCQSVAEGIALQADKRMLFRLTLPTRQISRKFVKRFWNDIRRLIFM